METGADKAIEFKEPQNYNGVQVKSITEAVSVEASSGDLLSLGKVDHALTAKMNLLNDVCLL